MSDDWARKYIDIHKQRQQEKQDEQSRGQLARAGAPDMFQRIKSRVQQDLKTLHDAGVLQSLQVTHTTATSFTVNDMSRREGSRLTLIVELKVVLVEYHYFFPKREREDRALRIGSDLEGVIRVCKNGEDFADESEVSEFLLRPLLDAIDG
jgi:hypothetical protein